MPVDLALRSGGRMLPERSRFPRSKHCAKRTVVRPSRRSCDEAHVRGEFVGVARVRALLASASPAAHAHRGRIRCAPRVSPGPWGGRRGRPQPGGKCARRACDSSAPRPIEPDPRCCHGTLTTLGSTIVVVPLFVAALVLLIWRRHRREALFLAVSMAGSLVLNQSLKLIFQRPRPQLAWAQVQPEYSFPSGHAMNSIVF